MEAEEEAKDGKSKPFIPTEDDFKRIEMEGLIRPEHLNIFVTWFAFGGLERGLSINDILTLPAELLEDFKYLTRRLGEIRERRPKKKND